MAFGLLGQLLHTERGEGRFLPQHSPHWLAFRRLFLRIVDQPIPSAIRERGIWDKLVEQLPGQVDYFKKLGTVPDNLVLPRDHPWEEKFLPHLSTIKEITEKRLRDYSGFSLQAVKEHFVEHGSVSLEKECGALYHVVQAIEWADVRDFILHSESPQNTQELLRKIVEEEGIEMEIEAEYEQAEKSVRGVLFDLAAESVLGPGNHINVGAREAEKLFCDNLLLQDPFSLLTNEQLLFHLADQIGCGDSAFLNSLAARMETIEDFAHKYRTRVKVSPVKRVMAYHWLHPDLPLWLMQAPAILSVFKTISFVEMNLSDEIVREAYRNRPERGTSLYRGSKKLIKTVTATQAKKIKGMGFQGYVESAKSFSDLEAHVSHWVASRMAEIKPGRNEL